MTGQSHCRAGNIRTNRDRLSSQNAAGEFAYMLANYADEKRRFDSYATEAEGLEAAGKLASQLSIRDTIGAGMTKAQCLE